MIRDTSSVSNFEPSSLPSRLSGQKILVTGASGFLGSHLCRRLSEDGAEVYAISRSLHPSQTNSLRWRQGDMSDLATVRSLLETVRPEIIFHLSGLVTASPDRELVLPTLQSLLVSTVNLLTVAADLGCSRVVLAASLTEPEQGSAEVVPASPYAAAKWASGAYGRMFHKLYGLPVVIVRPFQTYGPGQDINKLVPYVTRALLRNEAPKLSNAQWQVDWIYVDDVIDGFLAAIHAPEVEGCTIDLGSGSVASTRTVVQQLIHLTGSQVTPLFGALADRPFEQVRAANTAYAYAKLGWKATTSLEEGLRRTVAWYAQQQRGYAL